LTRERHTQSCLSRHIEKVPSTLQIYGILTHSPPTTYSSLFAMTAHRPTAHTLGVQETRKMAAISAETKPGRQRQTDGQRDGHTERQTQADILTSVCSFSNFFLSGGPNVSAAHRKKRMSDARVAHSSYSTRIASIACTMRQVTIVSRLRVICVT